MKIQLLNISNAGELDKECVKLKVLEDCDLADFIVGISLTSRTATNTLGGAFRFTSRKVVKGDYVWVCTKKAGDYHGRNRYKTTTYVFHFGMEAPLWSDRRKQAILFEVAGSETVAAS